MRRASDLVRDSLGHCGGGQLGSDIPFSAESGRKKVSDPKCAASCELAEAHPTAFSRMMQLTIELSARDKEDMMLREMGMAVAPPGPRAVRHQPENS